MIQYRLCTRQFSTVAQIRSRAENRLEGAHLVATQTQRRRLIGNAGSNRTGQNLRRIRIRRRQRRKSEIRTASGRIIIGICRTHPVMILFARLEIGQAQRVVDHVVHNRDGTAIRCRRSKFNIGVRRFVRLPLDDHLIFKAGTHHGARYQNRSRLIRCCKCPEAEIPPGSRVFVSILESNREDILLRTLQIGQRN